MIFYSMNARLYVRFWSVEKKIYVLLNVTISYDKLCMFYQIFHQFIGKITKKGPIIGKKWNNISTMAQQKWNIYIFYFRLNTSIHQKVIFNLVKKRMFRKIIVCTYVKYLSQIYFKTLINVHKNVDIDLSYSITANQSINQNIMFSFAIDSIFLHQHMN